MPILATSGDPHCGRWPCPRWTIPHCPSIRMGEDTIATPPVPARNHQSTVVHLWMCLLARHKQGHRRSREAFSSVRPAPSSKPKMLQHPSLQCQLQPAHGRCAPQTSSPWKELTTWICGDFYSKMILIQCLPSGQSYTVKVISLLKEMFSEHGIPKVLCSDNCPHHASAQFTECCTSWGITHETSSPHYPQLNRFAKACVKSMKHALQHAKYSSADPQLALLALQATPIDAKLPLPAELLY